MIRALWKRLPEMGADDRMHPLGLAYFWGGAQNTVELQLLR